MSTVVCEMAPLFFPRWIQKNTRLC